MSLELLRDSVSELPRGLADQVVGYAESVERQLPEIFASAGRHFDRAVADEFVFLVGVAKLHSIVVSSFWTLDNSATLLAQFGIDRVRAGAIDYSRGAQFYQRIVNLLNSLESVATRHNLSEYLNASPSAILRILIRNEH
jgi:hypothetical protein